MLKLRLNIFKEKKIKIVQKEVKNLQKIRKNKKKLLLMDIVLQIYHQLKEKKKRNDDIFLNF